MKRGFLFLLYTILIAVYVSFVARLIPKPVAYMPKSDRLKSDITDHDGILPDSNFPDINFNDASLNADLGTEKLIDVPVICQYPQLPTGCECVAAAMVLQYYHADITAEKFASDWLECNENFYLSSGNLYGPDPDEVFVGNPFTDSSYGCFAEAIVHAVNRNSTNCTAQTITDQSLEQLCAKYIDNDKPLLIWATMNMRESTAGDSWYFEDGTAFTWIAGEHCFVLVGYNDAYYFLNDPMSGSIVSYRKELADKRFAELGNQAVYISPNETIIDASISPCGSPAISLCGSPYQQLKL